MKAPVKSGFCLSRARMEIRLLFHIIDFSADGGQEARGEREKNA